MNETRRTFFGALAGFLGMLGIGKATAAVTPTEPLRPAVPQAVPEPEPLRMVMVFYIDVGMMSPAKALPYMERLKADLKDGGMKDRPGVERYFIPVRPPNRTRVDVFWVTGQTDKTRHNLQEKNEPSGAMSVTDKRLAGTLQQIAQDAERKISVSS